MGCVLIARCLNQLIIYLLKHLGISTLSSVGDSGANHPLPACLSKPAGVSDSRDDCETVRTFSLGFASSFFSFSRPDSLPS